MDDTLVVILNICNVLASIGISLVQILPIKVEPLQTQSTRSSRYRKNKSRRTSIIVMVHISRTPKSLSNERFVRSVFRLPPLAHFAH